MRAFARFNLRRLIRSITWNGDVENRQVGLWKISMKTLLTRFVSRWKHWASFSVSDCRGCFNHKSRISLRSKERQTLIFMMDGSKCFLPVTRSLKARSQSFSNETLLKTRQDVTSQRANQIIRRGKIFAKFFRRVYSKQANKLKRNKNNCFNFNIQIEFEKVFPSLFHFDFRRMDKV